jgi:sugar O-acyltransferase (sialic acid O-acetyltransferase NeuD family)
MLTSLSIIGSGGHAKVVIEALCSYDKSTKIKVFDENPSKNNLLLNQYSIDLLFDLSKLEDNFHVAIGSNDARSRLSNSAILAGKNNISIIHEKAMISKSAEVLDGSFVAANSIISSEVIVQNGCIINHSAVIDHDCVIGKFSHIAPNVTLSGGVKIGQQCLIGAGSVVLPNINIGDFAIVGAGSVVIKDISDGKIFAGNPATDIT